MPHAPCVGQTSFLVQSRRGQSHKARTIEPDMPAVRLPVEHEDAARLERSLQVYQWVEEGALPGCAIHRRCGEWLLRWVQRLRVQHGPPWQRPKEHARCMSLWIGLRPNTPHATLGMRGIKPPLAFTTKHVSKKEGILLPNPEMSLYCTNIRFWIL